MASLQAALTALERLQFPFTDLPADRHDPLWPQIQQEANLSLAQLSALKNERCKGPSDAGTMSPSTSAMTISLPITAAPPAVEAKSTALEYTAEAQRAEACGEALQGYLFKAGTGLLAASYKRRFVLLSNQLIQYFADESRTALKGEIFLRPQSVVTKRADNSQWFAFDVVPLRNGRVYHFAAKDAAERDLWMGAIQAAISHCEDPRKQLCLVGENLRRLHQKRAEDDDVPPGTPSLVSQVSSLSHGTLLIKCKGEWEEQEWRIHDDYLVFPEAGIRYGLREASFKLIPSEGPLVLGLKRRTDGLGLLLKSQTRPRMKRLVRALSLHASYIGDKLSDVEDDEL